MTGGHGPRDACRVGSSRQGLRLADQRAEIGVFPLLDPAIRQADRLEAGSSGLAQRHDLAIARQLGLRGLISLAQRLFGMGFHAANFGIHDASTPSSWYCA